MSLSYRVFTRTWWKKAVEPGWPNNLEPSPGRKHTINIASTEAEARACCQEYQRTHKPGLYSRKAEYEKQ